MTTATPTTTGDIRQGCRWLFWTAIRILAIILIVFILINYMDWQRLFTDVSYFPTTITRVAYQFRDMVSEALNPDSPVCLAGEIPIYDSDGVFIDCVRQ